MDSTVAFGVIEIFFFFLQVLVGLGLLFFFVKSRPNYGPSRFWYTDEELLLYEQRQAFSYETGYRSWY